MQSVPPRLALSYWSPFILGACRAAFQAVISFLFYSVELHQAAQLPTHGNGWAFSRLPDSRDSSPLSSLLEALETLV